MVGKIGSDKITNSGNSLCMKFVAVFVQEIKNKQDNNGVFLRVFL